MRRAWPPAHPRKGRRQRINHRSVRCYGISGHISRDGCLRSSRHRKPDASELQRASAVARKRGALSHAYERRRMAEGVGFDRPGSGVLACAPTAASAACRAPQGRAFPRYSLGGGLGFESHNLRSEKHWRRGWDSTVQAPAFSPAPPRPPQPPAALRKVALSLATRSAAASGSNPIISDLKNIGGGGGIRTHVAARTAKSISSRPRYGHFGTPPRAGTILYRKESKTGTFLKTPDC